MREGSPRTRRRALHAAAVAVLAGLLAAPAAFLGALPAGAQPLSVPDLTSFSDVSGVPWAEPDLAILAAQGVVHGVAADRFAPGASVTEEQAVTLVARLFPGSVLPPARAAMPEGVDSWAQAAVEWAVGANVVRNPSAFIAAAPAPRARVVAWVVRALGLSGGGAPTFSDAADIPPQYASEVGTAQAAGLVTGDANGDFLPGEPVDRAQMAVILARAERALAMAGSSGSALFDWTFQQGSATQTVASGQVRLGSASILVGSLDAGTVSTANGAVQVTFLASRGLGAGTLVVNAGAASGTWPFAWQRPSGLQGGTLWLLTGGAEPPTYGYTRGPGGVAAFQEVAGQQETTPGLNGGTLTANPLPGGGESAGLCLRACPDGGSSEQYVGPALPDAVLWTMEVGAAAVLAPGSMSG